MAMLKKIIIVLVLLALSGAGFVAYWARQPTPWCPA